VEGKNNTGVDE